MFVFASRSFVSRTLDCMMSHRPSYKWRSVEWHVGELLRRARRLSFVPSAAMSLAVVSAAAPNATSAQTSAGSQPGPVSARSTIFGEVVHAETSLPLAGASVVLMSGGALGTETRGESAFVSATRSTVTDVNGAYRFEGLSAGPYTLRVHRLGFRPATIEVRLRGMDSRVSVGLSVVPIKLHPLNVAAETPEPYARSAASAADQSSARRTALEQRQRLALSTDVRELTHADVAEAVTLGETDLFRALQRLPGVSTRDEFTAELWTRGGRWDHTRVLFDGLPLFNPVSGLGAFSSINADVIGGAMLYPGVRPAGLAEGAAGLLDLRTRSAGGGGELRGVGELSIASARLTLDQRVADGRGGWLLAGRRSYLDAVMPLFVDGPDSRFPFHLAELAGRFDWQLGADKSLELSALHATDRISGDVNDFVEGNRAHWGNTAARVTLSVPLGPLTARHTLGTSLYEGRMAVSPNESRGPETTGESPERPVLARVRHFKLSTEVAPAGVSGARWSAGADVVVENSEVDGDVRSIYTGDALSLERTRWTSSLPRIELWGERRFEPTPALSVDVGARLDLGGRVRNGGPARLGPRAVARYALGDATHLSGAFGRSFQYSQAIPAWGGMSENIAYPIPLWSLAGPQRPALRSDIATVGVDRWIGSAWYASANAYWRQSTGVLFADPTPGAVTTHEIAVAGQETSRGMEVGIRRVEGRATLAAGYSLAVTNAKAAGLRFPGSQDRRHGFDLTAMVRATRGLRLGLAYTASSGAPFTRRRGGSYGVDGDREFWIEAPSVDAPNAGRHRPWSSLDFLVDWTGTIRRARVGMFVQLHNALDRDNPGAYAGARYCSPWDEAQNGCRPVDTFDAGLPRLPVVGFRVAF
jgi:hypothetical protein